jgi:hypothetical protein
MDFLQYSTDSPSIVAENDGADFVIEMAIFGTD